MEEKIMKAVTRQFRVISPYSLNDHDSLLGGNALKWMSEVAYITATRFTRIKMVYQQG
jgi:acyl-CoA hydrolase